MRRLVLATSLSLLVACQPTAQTPVAADATPSTTAQAPAAFAFEEADIASLQKQMAAGSLSSALTQAYLDRIAAIDDAGPTPQRGHRDSIPTRCTDADALDAERKAGKLRGPLHGIPVLLKDNIDTVDRMANYGRLAGAGRQPPDDATPSSSRGCARPAR